MKRIALLLLFLVSNQLLAQTPPVVTLSANTFYRGDAAGTYTIACPAGTNAGVSALTKIADVPLLDPSNTQYGVGVVFPWPSANSASPTLTGTLPQSNTQSVMGKVIYNAGVLVGTAYCNAIPAINSSSSNFTITLGGTTRDEAPQAQARVTYALKANSVKLPQLGTTEQNTLPPQQAGNLIYNTDQQRVAVHTGTSWQYLSNTAPEATPFQHEKLFMTPGTTLWTVPTGVTLIVAEVWGAGAGGTQPNSLIAPGMNGGGAGGYARGFMVVTPGNTLTLTVGSGGTRGSPANGGETPPVNGGMSVVYRDATNAIGAYGGSIQGSGGMPFGTDAGFGVQGGVSSPGSIVYMQSSTNVFIDVTRLGNGGTAYGAQPGGIGQQASTSTSLEVKNGSFPGGGGGGGYSFGGHGAGGMIIIHW